MMQERCTQEQVCRYLNYLREQCGLSVSLHFSTEYPFEHQDIAALKEYNIHTNPYCFYVKNIRGEIGACIACQRKILARCRTEETFSEACHAGVLQYIRRIVVGEEVVGFVCVSGYRDLEQRAEREERYLKCLSSEEIPTALLESLLPPLTMMLSGLTAQVPRTEKGDVYTKLLSLLQNDPNASLEELSSELGCSRSYISHMFRRRSGCTLKEYCSRPKIDEAKLLLRTTDLPVTEVALSCGYNNFSYFISSFRKAVGTTPLAWRKQSGKASEIR